MVDYMPTFGLNKIKELEPMFMSYLNGGADSIMEYDNILSGLQDLNANHKHKPVVFINSKCSGKKYVCINCGNDEFDHSLQKLIDIFNLYNYRIQNSRNIIREYGNK